MHGRAWENWGRGAAKFLTLFPPFSPTLFLLCFTYFYIYTYALNWSTNNNFKEVLDDERGSKKRVKGFVIRRPSSREKKGAQKLPKIVWRFFLFVIEIFLFSYIWNGYPFCETIKRVKTFKGPNRLFYFKRKPFYKLCNLKEVFKNLCTTKKKKEEKRNRSLRNRRFSPLQ